MIDAKQYWSAQRTTIKLPFNHGYLGEFPYLADLGSDGTLDLILFGGFFPWMGTNFSAQRGVVLTQKPDGKFVLNQELTQVMAGAASEHAREIVIADFNKDGKPDLFEADQGYDAQPFAGAANQFILSQPGGYAVRSDAIPQTPDFSHNATAADINGDGNLDIFVGNLSQSESFAPKGTRVNSYFLLGDGKGGFTQTPAGLTFGPADLLWKESFRPLSSLLADLNGDGLPELILGHEGGSWRLTKQSLVFWNQGGTYSQSHVTVLPNGYFGSTPIVHDIVSFDIDSDGDGDLMLMTSEQDPVYADGWAIDVYRNEGGGVFVEASADYFGSEDRGEGRPGEASGTGAGDRIHRMDVDGDGNLDIVVTEVMNNLPSDNAPMVWLNDGFSHFTVALRAGDLRAAADDKYFVSSGLLPYMTANGLSFVKSSSQLNEDTLYQTQLIASKPIPSVSKIVATARNDTIHPNASNNTIDGAAGIDTVALTIKRADAHVTKIAAGWQVNDGRSTDVLVNVERLSCTDGALALDLDGHAGQAARVLGAVFGPGSVSNAAYVGIGIGLLDGGIGYEALMQLALDVALPGARTNTQIVDLLYRNVVGMTAPKGDRDYLVGLLDTKALTPASLGVLAAETALNAANIDLVGLSKSGLAFLPMT